MFEIAVGGNTKRKEACDDDNAGDEDGDGGSTERDVNPSLMATLVLPSLVLCIQRKHC